MPIKLNGATSGSVELDVPAAVTGGDVNLVVPGAGTLDRLERAGNILQVVQGSTTTLVTVSTTTFTPIGLQASITPTSTSNKILLLVSVQYQCVETNNNAGHGTRVKRNSTVIKTPVQGGSGPYEVWRRATGATEINYYDSLNYQTLDTPSTTSSITYSVEGAPYSGAGVVHYQTAGSINNATSTITLIEVAG